jgi:hypothetical protein
MVSILFRRQSTWPVPINPHHRFTVYVFVGVELQRANAGSFVCSEDEWAALFPALCAAGSVEVMP